VPQYIVHRLMYPVMVLPHNVADVTARMRAGGVLFVQRGDQPQPRMRAISHIAVQQYVPEDGDRLIRRGNKHPLHRPPLPSADDIALPVQCADGGVPPLCFGDRIFRARDRRLLDPLRSVSWPVLHVGDTVLATPVDGDLVLMNRQPTLVQESMLGMRLRIGPALSFGSTCGPIEALRGAQARPPVAGGRRPGLAPTLTGTRSTCTSPRASTSRASCSTSSACRSRSSPASPGPPSSSPSRTPWPRRTG
jgi:hypothetical protein